METALGSCCRIIPFQTNRNRVRSIERLPTYAPCSIGEAKWRCKCSNQRQQWLRSSRSGCFFLFATGNHSPCKQSQDLKSLLLLGCSKSVGYAQTFSRDPACLVGYIPTCCPGQVGLYASCPSCQKLAGHTCPYPP